MRSQTHSRNSLPKLCYAQNVASKSWFQLSKSPSLFFIQTPKSNPITWTFHNFQDPRDDVYGINDRSSSVHSKVALPELEVLCKEEKKWLKYIHWFYRQWNWLKTIHEASSELKIKRYMRYWDVEDLNHLHHKLDTQYCKACQLYNHNILFKKLQVLLHSWFWRPYRWCYLFN